MSFVRGLAAVVLAEQNKPRRRKKVKYQWYVRIPYLWRIFPFLRWKIGGEKSEWRDTC